MIKQARESGLRLCSFPYSPYGDSEFTGAESFQSSTHTGPPAPGLHLGYEIMGAFLFAI